MTAFLVAEAGVAHLSVASNPSLLSRFSCWHLELQRHKNCGGSTGQMAGLADRWIESHNPVIYLLLCSPSS